MFSWTWLQRVSTVDAWDSRFSSNVCGQSDVPLTSGSLFNALLTAPRLTGNLGDCDACGGVLVSVAAAGVGGFDVGAADVARVDVDPIAAIRVAGVFDEDVGATDVGGATLPALSTLPALGLPSESSEMPLSRDWEGGFC